MNTPSEIEGINVNGFQMVLKWNKLESVNKMYMRTSTGMTLSPESRKFKREVAKQVRIQLPNPLPFNNKDVFKLSLQFVLKSRFFIRDTSNFIKLVEDCIFDELDINDARNIELECKKSYFPDSDYEFVLVTIEKSTFDYEYFQKSFESDKLKEEEEENNNLTDVEEIKEEEITYTESQVIELLKAFSINILNSRLHTDLDSIARNKATNEIPKFLKLKREPLKSKKPRKPRKTKSKKKK